MALLSLRNATVAFGGPPVLDHAHLTIDRGERVCLLGRNGAGKSTLMKLLDGSVAPDDGEVIRQTGVTVARLDQEVPGDLAGTVFDIAAAGLGDAGSLIARYHDASHRLGADDGASARDAALRELDRLHQALEASGGWQLETRVETVLSHLGLDPDAPFSTLSGGRKRQTLLARALVREPDLLLLDEPTNHLDIDAIEWMETFLLERGITLLFVTHDRAFLRRLATRIVELDRGQLRDWGTDYDSYLDRKEAALAAEAREWAEFDKKLAREEAWIRTGIKARRTRNEGRVRALDALRLERQARRDRVGTAKLQAQEAERSGHLVIDTRDVTIAHDERAIVRGLTTTIVRGDRVGVIGPNGSGKTTLLRLLLGELPPTEGSIRHGANLEIAYFDQLREQLDPAATVAEAVADGNEWVELAGSRKHVIGYLQDFLFPRERAETPVRALSGGERNRLLLARLFTRSFNVLALDEPTNDLDVETLELLETVLLDFSGTLLVVSHDRAFLDNVVTSTLVMEGGGRVGEYVGGYSDWLRQRAAPSASATPPKPRAAPRPVTPPKPRAAPRPVTPPRTTKTGKRRLTFKETQELAVLPDRIDALEREREELYASLADHTAIRVNGAALRDRLQALEVELAAALARWEELELLAAPL